MAVLFITHDLAVVAETADDVAVMYGGKLVETGSVRAIFKRPLHPYTRLLFRSLPRPDERRAKLETIRGNVPSPLEFPPGCKFGTRCPLYDEICGRDEPALREFEPGHFVSCHVAEEVEERL